MATVDLGIVYEILAAVAPSGQLTYSQLSDAYRERTGEWHEPQGHGMPALGELNNRLARAGLPPLSAVVVLAETSEPGGGFWGSAPSVPVRPKSETERIAAYARLLQDVQRAAWPEHLP